jgi:rhodanese-related sulfurtransferase
MATTLTREQQLAVEHFERKLEFEIGPYGIKHAADSGERLQIVDLRTPELFAKGHVPGAVNISFEELEAAASRFDKNAPVVLYCYNITCNLAAKAALALAKKGLRVKELVGGYEEYAKAELPIEKKSGGSCSCG